ncbi:phospholipid methyltransferase [Aureobasidium pullulans]|uniref:Phosphatidyl-N-methylethanolamine N-methyltransferase n=1 Tax=Aureobasidium pullulans TaxID=5580 RepID=A0A4S9XMS6_AURPU|nr:phospholipid methyltransferase [Aureobasidium pullulans]
MSSISDYVDLGQPMFWLSVASIVFNPTFWNTAARSEYHNKTITKLFGGNSLYGCYALAVTIFTIGIIRDSIDSTRSGESLTYDKCTADLDFSSYERALRTQPTHPLLTGPVSNALALALFTSGNILVLTSMYALGITGTYLGDYFGILMDEMVTGFPFNICSAPMYYGSTLSFLGSALWFGKPAGVVLTGVVFVVYKIALRFEDPFTGGIYAERERKEKVEGKKSR